MVRSVIIMMSLLTPPSTGMWITAAGEEVEKPCPSAMEMTDKARLPRGCVAHVQGVWMSRATYKVGELARRELEEKLLNARAREAALQDRIFQLEMQVTLNTVEAVCPPCSCSTEIITSTALAVGGCALWTLSR